MATEEERLAKVAPWIGRYIAAASVVCVVAMGADAVGGFRSKRLWFPCKYFSLNALSLTLLGIAVKFLLDLSAQMEDNIESADTFASLTSAAFITTAMSNFLPSLGSMSDKAILANSTALGLLVVTLVVNMWIPFFLFKGLPSDLTSIYLIWTPGTLMLLSLITFASVAIALPGTKRSLESKYQERCKVALRRDEELHTRDVPQVQQMVGEMKKYLVMSETNNPQFVLARSVIISVTSGALGLTAGITFIVSCIVYFISEGKPTLGRTRLAYGESLKWIWVAQFIGISIASIVSILRWLISISFKCPITDLSSLRQMFRIEWPWIEALVYWRDSFTIMEIGYFHKCRKYLHSGKWFALTFCIGMQIFIVIISKLVHFISTLLVTPIFLCFISIKNLWVSSSRATTLAEHDSGSNDEMVNLSHYVLLLEGEGTLPKWILKSICNRADNFIQTGRKKQPKYVIHLLTKVNNFNGIREFDNIHVQSLLSQEPPNCWTLPLVTLASIVISLPDIPDHKVMQLMKGVSEGLSLVKLIDQNLDKNGRILNVRRVADVTWAGVAVYRKWQDIDLKRKSDKCKNSKEALEELRANAKRIILKFKQERQDFPLKDPLNWPVKVISACSMYRITQTILMSCQGEEEQTDEELFDKLCVMIADILAACLTNLKSLIMRMCKHEAIEKREESIHKAFLLLGQAEQILEILQRHGWPYQHCNDVTSIDEWRAGVHV